MSTDTIAAPSTRPHRVADFAELVKARLTFLVLVTTAAGFYLGASGPTNYSAMFHAVFGAALAAAGASALNQWWERRLDAMMQRTQLRPLPAGRMSAFAGVVIGAALACAGVVYLNLMTNVLAALLTAATIVIYVFAYTPLKRVSTANTLVGAIPGAIPPMIGWAAARGEVDAGAWSLFAILFLWQMPHFFAIAWMFRHDYDRAGFQMISSGDESGKRSASHAVLFAMFLLLGAAAPTFVGLAHPIYLPIEIALSGMFVAMAMRFLRTQLFEDARKLFLASIVYLPLLLIALALTKR